MNHTYAHIHQGMKTLWGFITHQTILQTSGTNYAFNKQHALMSVKEGIIRTSKVVTWLGLQGRVIDQSHGNKND